MTTKTSTSCSRRTLLAGLGVAALMAVASDASAVPTPITDADILAFNGGVAKHVVPSRGIPQSMTSPGFRVTLTRDQSQPTLINVKVSGELFVPSFSYKALVPSPSGSRWALVDRTIPAGFRRVSASASMYASVRVASVSYVLDGEPVVFRMTFNETSPKSILVELVHRQANYNHTDMQYGVAQPKPISHTSKDILPPVFYYVHPNGSAA
ncbi:MAG: hypothetical protein KIT84_30715 [Labilithrix sp.]|nr:hypothetical protein [Labilithrix sp.]MCW5815440.1 hypothetical protein [Labilithrix sp.]